MRPKVTVNCAMSADGKIALDSRHQTRISSESDIARVHRLRNSSDAILVGIRTVLGDDPSLLVKEKYVRKLRQPLRIVLDSNGRTPRGAKITSPGAPTLIAVAGKCVQNIWGQNVDVRAVGPGPLVSIPMLLEELSRRGVKNLLVEGGETVIWSFLKEGVVDRFILYVGSLVLGGHGPTPCGGEGVKRVAEAIRMKLTAVKRMGDGVLLFYEPLG